MQYRADIDGVRAVAVGSVILAHAGVPFIAGGFLGVDVFFVISGYLITTILMRELEDGRYSILQFYERRARRILPALLIVILACVPFATWLMLPEYFKSFGQSVVATLLFSNNILLAMTSGYWDLESGFKPLLHTWSLGVEEQFYIVFPLLLAGIWKYGRRAQITMILVLGVVSFILSEVGWRMFPDVNFYLPTSRAWELMVGCAIAYAPRREARFDNWLALAGLAAIVAPMFLFDEHTPSPSFFSAVPVIGAAAVILYCRPGSLAHRVLSWKPMVGLGLISYSAYLWHQPLFAFARIASLEPPSPFEIGLLTAATIGLAWLSWRYVEVPFRRREAFPIKRFARIVTVPALALVAGGTAVHAKGGFPDWTFPGAPDAVSYVAYNERIRDYSAERFPANGRPNVLLVGDSFARDVGNILFEAGALEGKNLVYAFQASWDGQCLGLPEGPYKEASVVIISLHRESEECARSMKEMATASTEAPVIFFGPKHFGYNINPFGRVAEHERAETLSSVPAEMIARNSAFVKDFAPGEYVDLIAALGPDGGRIRFFDDDGMPLDVDRLHLTRYGARYVARALNGHPALRAIGEAD